VLFKKKNQNHHSKKAININKLKKIKKGNKKIHTRKIIKL